MSSCEEYDFLEMFESALKWKSSSAEYEVMWKCFRFCYLFPEKYEFYMDDIVRLWTAQDFVDDEETGYVYFKQFQNLHIFQDSRFDYITGRPRYQINHPVFDLLQNKFGDDDEFFRADDDSRNLYISENTLHAWICECDPNTLNMLHHSKRLSTLHAHGNYLDQLPRNIFLELRLLKALDLNNTRITNLPSSIGALENLRYLDLSGTPITYLPNSLCNLFQLQTLKLKGCLNLVALPKGIRKLIKLRHLDVDDACILASMPLCFRDLVELRTLPAFVVDKEDGCHINELRHMVNLQGTLRILMLENVSSSREAKAAALHEKKHIHSLEFNWTELQDGFNSLNNLQAPLELKELQIVGYGGDMFPKWIGNHLFSQLVTISLNNCPVCELLPPLGDLPSLKDLCTSHMHSIQLIDDEFCSSNIAKKSLDLLKQKVGTIKDNSMFNGFPSLVKFTLNEMPMLIRWSGVEKGDFHVLQQLNISRCPKLTTLPKLSMLVSLKELEIVLCPLLDSFLDEDLPTSLQYLVIIDCPMLKEWCHKENGSNLGKMAHVPNIWIDHEQILQAQQSPTITNSSSSSQNRKTVGSMSSTSTVDKDKDLKNLNVHSSSMFTSHGDSAEMLQEIVIELSSNDKKSRVKALKIAVNAQGVQSVEVQGDDKSKLVVRGKGINALSLVVLLRKKVGHSQIISITPIHNKEKEKSESKFESKSQLYWPIDTEYATYSMSHDLPNEWESGIRTCTMM